MKITHDNNFCRVFELPLEWPRGYCFNEPHRCEMVMVDWFNPAMETKFGSGVFEPWEETAPKLKAFVAEKSYCKPWRKYLLVTDFGEALIITKQDATK